MMKRSHFQERVAAVGFALALVGLWQLLATLQWISPLFFPSPGRTLGALWQQAADGRLWEPLLATVERMVWGWLLASVLGVLLGALIAGSLLARRLLDPLLEFMRPLPASAIIPIAILAFGLSSTMSLAVIAFGSIWPVLLASVQGFGAVDERLREVSAVMRMSAWSRFMKIDLPSAMPGILAGARVGLAVALILAVVTEMQASLTGIGQNILLAQRSFKTPDLYAGVVLLGVIGFITSTVIQTAENHVLRWRGSAT
ncbi:ABC transporter permease [Hydrogenophaga sp. OTU3427]|uniref:ABC transporter permease n=1 Tax=Hydrogenophaga sp. OTU3427 TaxID=3043856 RepID=UPI00313D2E1A